MTQKLIEAGEVQARIDFSDNAGREIQEKENTLVKQFNLYHM
jgi:hypothetical protein